MGYQPSNNKMCKKRTIMIRKWNHRCISGVVREEKDREVLHYVAAACAWTSPLTNGMVVLDLDLDLFGSLLIISKSR